jgi:polar amino acid transport system permease protein
VAVDFELMVTSIPRLLEGAVLTLQLVSLSLILGIMLALPLALCRVSRHPALWMPVYGYIFYFRGTPLLVQIFLTYYGLGQFEAVRESFLWPVLREAYWCAIIAFTMNTAAYTAEILRGGILAVPAGEVEAARAMGMALPAYGNEVILMLKASALASTITLLDLTGVARVIVARSFAPYELFLTAGVIYLLMTFAVTRAVREAEYRLSPHLRPPPL